jgi:hypothetical protein
MSAELLPAESIALTVALAQVKRGESPDPHVAAMCVLALARIAGRHDWTGGRPVSARRAAALMRERAEAARDVTGASDWFAMLGGELHAGDYWVKSSGGRVCLGAAEEEAEHIASWRPAVALAVADWLDEVAGWREEGLGLNPSTNFADAWGEIERCAHRVARAYLGADA